MLPYINIENNVQLCELKYQKATISAFTVSLLS
jgi:hypothetical protein